MEAWFLSDIHLKSMEERNGKILLRFLHSLLERNPEKIQLFLLGDIFDLWIGSHDYFVRQYQPLIDALKNLKALGARIIYFEGNHDVHIDKFFQHELGAEVFTDARYFEIQGLTVRCEHGDLINREDHAYLKYRSIIRGAVVRAMALHLPGPFWGYVGMKMSHSSRKKSAVYRSQNELQLIQMIRNHVGRAYLERSFDYIISGHMHVFDDYCLTIHEQNIRSINLGSWFEDEVKVFRIIEGRGDWFSLPLK